MFVIFYKKGMCQGLTADKLFLQNKIFFMSGSWLGFERRRQYFNKPIYWLLERILRVDSLPIQASRRHENCLAFVSMLRYSRTTSLPCWSTPQDAMRETQTVRRSALYSHLLRFLQNHSYTYTRLCILHSPLKRCCRMSSGQTSVML